eukprot:45637-Alexandrium_andersonii.AAC.1
MCKAGHSGSSAQWQVKACELADRGAVVNAWGLRATWSRGHARKHQAACVTLHPRAQHAPAHRH